MRDYRAGGGGAAPAGVSYRGNRTSGEVPQWLVDTCNEDDDYEDYEYEHDASHDVRDNSQHDANFPVGAYQGSAYGGVRYGKEEFGNHSSDVPIRRASRKSSLDTVGTVDTVRRDNTRGGISYRQQFQDDNDSSYRRQFQYDNGPSHNFDDGDVNVGKQQSYMAEPYEYQERSQVEDEDYQSISDANGPDYYFPHLQQERTNSYRQEPAHAPQRQTFKEYQRYVMEQQQYLKSNKSGKGRGILDVVGGSVRNLFTGGMNALQLQGQSRSNLYRDIPPKRPAPPRQSSMRHRDGSLRGGRYQQSSQRQTSRPRPSSGVPSQAFPPEQPEYISRQMELMMLELQGDAVPLRGGGRDRTMPQRQQPVRSVKPAQPHWDPSQSGSRFGTRSPSVQSFESSLSSLSSARALRYHDDEFSKTDDQEEECDDTTNNGQELICGWSREDEGHRGNGGVTSSNNDSYEVDQPQRDSHPRYQMHQYYSNGPNPQQSHHEDEETDAYESFHDILPRQAEGSTPRNKLLGMMKTGKQVSFRHIPNDGEQQVSSRPPLIPNGGERPPPKPILRRQAQDPGRNDGTMRRQDPVGHIPAHSNATSSLTSLTNYEIEAETENGGEEVGRSERRLSDVTFEVDDFLEGLNGSKGSLNSSGSLSAEEITSYINNM